MSQLRDMPAEFALALQFLSRVPVGRAAQYTPERWARIPCWFGLVGLGLGLVAAAALWAIAQVLPHPLAGIATLGLMLLLTGALHEDGLADAADGLGGGRTLERRLEIMRDSRIGSYGVLALVMALVLQATCLALLPLPWAMGALVLAHVSSRCIMALALGQGRYLRPRGAGTGLDQPLGARGFALTGAALLGAVVAGFALSLPVAAMLLTLGTGAAASIIWLRFARAKIDGDTGDTLGAAQVIATTACLIGVAAWL